MSNINITRGGNFTPVIPVISGNIMPTSTPVDYNVVREFIEEYLSNMEYVVDIDINDDGSVTIEKSKQ